jgi:hypothetical protein
VIVAHINTDEVPPYYGQDAQKAFPVI